MKAFGLDFSDSSFKIIELKREGKKTKLANYLDFPLTEGTIVKGRIVKEELLVEAIKTGIKKAKKGAVKTRFVVSCVPESESFVRVISLPKLPEDELAQGVRWEFEQHIPLALDQVYFDWQKVGQNNNGSRVLVAASPRKLVDAYIAVLKKAGLIPWAVEVESAATVRSLVKTQDKSCYLIVDIGFSRTVLIIYDQGVLQFTSSVEPFGQSFTKKISEDLKVGSGEAENLKRNYGIGGNRGVASKIEKSLLPLVRSLAQEVQEAIKFYADHFPEGQRVERIILCGGGSKLKGLVPKLKLNLKDEVVLGNPWVNILDSDRKYLPEITRKDSLGYATAIGLALRSLERGSNKS